MDDISLTIDTSQWEKLLAELPQRVARKAMRQALQAGGDVLAEAMEAEAPERTDTPTPGSDSLPPGILKADISTQVQIGYKNGARVKVGATEIAGHQAWWIENGFDHVEGGASDQSIAFRGKYGIKGNNKAGTVTKHIDANPFMARAFDSSINRAIEATLESLAASLSQDINDDSGTDAVDDTGGDEGEEE